MRIQIFAAAVLLATVPASAQSPVDVTGPRTLTPLMVACTDLPVVAKPEPRLLIKGRHGIDPAGLLATGHVVVIGRTPDDGLAEGQRYAVRRLQTDLRSAPRDGAGFGAVRTSGFVTITALDAVNALASVDKACAEILPGDYLDSYTAPVLPVAASAMAPPDFSDRGRVLEGTDRRAVFATGEMLSVDRGTVHGVAAGQRFAIYRDRRDGLPLIYLADAVAMESGELTSKLVVVTAVDVVTVDDVAVPRRQPN